MNDIPLSILFIIVGVLIVLSAFFSGTETGLLTLNRYRLRHRANQGERAAGIAARLLERPDRLLGVILLGNNFVNILASAIATMIGLRLSGDSGVAIATGVLTLVLLIFGEVTPKTLAALHPERVGLPAAYIYYPLLKLFYPVVYVVNLIANGILKLLRVYPDDSGLDSLSSEELRTVVAEAGAMIPQRHQRMLLSILDLEKATVEDIMVPRNEIKGIDTGESWEEIVRALVTAEHTRLPIYEGSIDDLRGVIHLRNLLDLLNDGQLDHQSLLGAAREPYFVPEGTPLNQQLLNFQNQKRRIGFVVDEYGDIQGLVTLEDILEEIVGEFTTDPAERAKHVFMESEDSYLVDGTVTIRSLNRSMGWKLPATGPKTLNGLILEYLETIPQTGARLKLNGYDIEIAQTKANAVKTVRIRPPKGQRRGKPART